MIAVIQKVIKAGVSIQNQTIGSIEKGIVVFLAIANTDGLDEVKKISNKSDHYIGSNQPSRKSN